MAAGSPGQHIKDPGYRNWLKVGQALWYMKRALHSFVKNEVNLIHKFLINTLYGGTTVPYPKCTICKASDIKQNKHTHAWRFITPPCPALCHDWLTEFLNLFVNPRSDRIYWSNCDVTSWAYNAWECAKAFMPMGQRPTNTDPSESDAQALLTLMANCKHFHRFLSHSGLQQTHKVSDVRNATMHAPQMKLTDAEMRSYIQEIIDLLEDPVHLQSLPECIAAVSDIKQIRDASVDVFLDLELDIRALRELQRETTEKLQNELDSQKCDLKSVHQELDLQKSDLEGIHQEMDSHDSRLTGLCHEIDSRKSDVKGLHQDMDLQRSDLSGIHQEMYLHKSDLEAIHKDIDSHESDLEVIHKDIDSHKSDLDVIHKDIDSHKSDLEVIRKDIDSQKNRIGLSEIKCDTIHRQLHSELKELSESGKTVSVCLTNLQQNVDIKFTMVQSEFKKMEHEVLYLREQVLESNKYSDSQVQSHFHSPDLVRAKTDPVVGQSDSSCHVGDHFTNPQFPTDPYAVIVPRAGWGARATRASSLMHEPVSIVFIHHTGTERCYSSTICMGEVKRIQNFHMELNGWDDIGYSFVVGEDGRAYEARGWDRVGAHTRGWNDVSISIAVIGNFNFVLPNESALRAINRLIEYGLREGKIKQDYKLYGHRDASQTFDSPGHMLYNLIKTWPHYTNKLPVRENN